MEKPKIVGISLIKNEDLYIDKVLTSITNFCDEIIVLDNMSTDNTYDIVEKMAKDNDKIKLHQIQNFRKSKLYTNPYMKTNTWVISVDGDEIYDKTGLVRMREEILEGKFKDKWAISGHFLNCTDVNWEKKTAEGYMSPPARPCVRLYNFNAIRYWSQRKHRMHGGKPQFIKGFNIDSRHSMHLHLDWDEAYLRFLHLCFIKRSSVDVSECRLNPTEIIMGRKRLVSGYKTEKYKIGDVFTKSIKGFIDE